MIYKEKNNSVTIEFEKDDTEHLKNSMKNAIYHLFDKNR